MALLDFPSGPTQDVTTYSLNGNTWKWNGTSWVAFNNLSLSSQVSGILAVQYGGTGFGGTYTKGDVLYALSSNTFGKLAAGTAGSVLSIDVSGDLYWKKDDAGSGTVGAGSNGGFAYYTSTTNISSGSGFSYISGTNNVRLTSGILSLSGSTIDSGVWAGTAISLANGGTNANLTASAGAVVYSTSTAFALSAVGTAGSILQSANTSAPVWVGQNTLVVGGATTAANIQGGAAGSIPYQSGGNATVFLNNPGAGYALTTVSATSVAYQTISSLAVGSASNSTTATTATNANNVAVNSATGIGSSYLVFVSAQSGNLPILTNANVTVDASTSTITATLAGTATTATRVGITTQSSAGSSYLYYGSSASGSAALGATTDITVNASTGTIIAKAFTGLATTATLANTVGITTQSSAGSSYLYYGSTASGSAALGATTTIYVTASTGTIVATTFSGTATSAQKANNIIGGSSSGQSIHIQTAADTTGFLNTPATTGLALTTTGSGNLAFGSLSNLAVTSLSQGTGINVSASIGSITVTNVGVTSITGTSNRVTVSVSGSGGTGAVTLTTPQDIATASSPTFADLTLATGSNSTLATVGSSSTSMVNKQYVDNLASGLDVHSSVRIVITSAIGASYYQPDYGIGNTATGAYLTSIGNSTLLAYDGVTIASTGITQRVLVVGGLTGTGKTSINGSVLVTPADSNLVNGIYYVGSVGSGSSQWYLYRATDTDDNTELNGGTFTFVEEGTTYKDSAWVCTNDTTNLGPIQFGSTAIAFSQFAGAAAFTSGQGLTKVGNIFATNVNLYATGAYAGIGYSQFNIGGPSVGGVADTGYYPTFSVRTSGTTVAGTALLQLNSTGFSLTGSTSIPATLTITGDISLPNPTQYGIAYGSGSNAVSFLIAGGSGASVLTQTLNNNPVYLGQSQLVVGGATTSANIQGGTQYNVVYQSNVSTTGFVGNAAGSGASILTQTGNAAPLFFGQSQLVVGGATTSANIQGGTQYNVVYQSNVSTTGFVGNAAGSGASILTQTGSAAPVYLGQSQLSVGSATNATYVNVVTTSGAGTSYLAIVSAISGNLPILADTNITVDAATNTITATNFSGIASSATRVGITTSVGAGTSYLYFGDTASGYGALGSTTDITVTASTGTIIAKSFSGLATSSSQVVTTADITNTLYLLGTRISGGTSGTIVYVDSSVSVQGVQVTAGIWAGTAISLANGGTNNTVAGNGYSSKVAVYNAAGTAITPYTITQGNVIFGATGGTFAGLASTLLPVACISANPPASPSGAIGATQAGQLWWDSTYGVLKIYYADTDTSQWVDATPVLGSSGGGSSTKRSYVMSFGAGFTPSTGADTISIQMPYAPDNSSQYYYIKRLDYRAETSGTGMSFFIERHTTGNASFSVANRIHSGAGTSFVTASGTFTTSYTLSSTGASFVSSSGIAGSVISGDYLRLNFSHINSAANMSISMVIEEQ
jgi:hypothetical protein